MSFKGKPIVVKITGNALEEFNKLNKVVGQELVKGIARSDHQILFSAAKQKIELLKENPQYGIHVPRNLIPAEYVKLYEIKNLWKINLPKGWRMLYTIRGSEVDIIALVLDIINHKNY